MAAYQYHTTQIVPITLNEAWTFFSSPLNLKLITPKYMNFKVLGNVEKEIYNNMLIDYTVSPLFKIPLSWQTRILEVVPNKSFIDIQEKGPFKKWEHIHRFSEVEEGTLIEDKVRYELPFGLLGSLAHSILVKSRVEGIFRYRRSFLKNIFEKGALHGN